MIDLDNIRAEAVAVQNAEQRVETLERIVLDLMLEIEALRAAVISLSNLAGPQAESDHVLLDNPAGVEGPHTAYERAYLESAWLSRWSAGPTSGRDKILELFYGDSSSSLPISVHRWREAIMLARLGYDENRIKQYIQSAIAAEECT